MRTRIPLAALLLLLLLFPAILPATSPATLPAQFTGYNRVKGDIRTVTHTGYTVSYNVANHCPDFVEWTLTGKRLAVEKASRTDEFTPDPDIPETPEARCYSHSGYDRGHMAPAADFKWSYQAMEESFYTSNVCPQRNALNAGLWLDLEKACRRWAKYYGSVDIVCGPVFLTREVNTIGDCHIRVPDAFFKVVLKQYKGRWYAMGWLMPNGETEGGMNDYALSVDEVESITGLDFFRYLDDDEEKEAESQTDTKYWR